MNIKHCFFLACLVAGLVGATVQPSSAECVELLRYYLKDPKAIVPPGELGGSEYALVKIISVHTDNKPRGRWGETGTLWLTKIESNGKSLPFVFSIPYQKRGGIMLTDCETWDDIVPKPGGRLLGFFRRETTGWAVPELPSGDVVLDADRINPALRKDIQPLFRTRL